jgi:hypothetical protein
MLLLVLLNTRQAKVVDARVDPVKHGRHALVRHRCHCRRARRRQQRAPRGRRVAHRHDIGGGAAPCLPQALAALGSCLFGVRIWQGPKRAGMLRLQRSRYSLAALPAVQECPGAVHPWQCRPPPPRLLRLLLLLLLL